MIRVVSVIPSLHFGGDEKRLMIFGAGADRSRFRHHVLVLRPRSAQMDAARGSLREAYAERGIAVEYFSGTSSNRGLASQLRLLAWLVRRLKEFRANIVDARMNYAIGMGVVAARLAGVPVTVGTAYHHHTLSDVVRYPLGQASVLALDALISDSQYVIDGYQKWLWRRLREAHVIFNGIPVPTSEKTRAEMRGYFAIPQDAQVIGQVSRLMPFKGQEILMRAAAEQLRSRPGLYLLLCGYAADPAYRAHLSYVAGELAITEKVRIQGYPGPIGDVWTAIDLHAHPSFLDSSPIAIHESMALGLPALVSDESGIPELVENGVTGLVVPKHDVAACRAGLERLLGDAGLCAQLGANARARYLERHTPEAMVQATEQLFERLVTAKARTAYH
jgi:glycosyltransferase involved in cell wall biosynthesis